MKKMLIGRISEIISCAICLVLMFSLVIISFFIETNYLGKISLILFEIISLIIAIFQIPKNKGICSYIRITEKNIQLKKFGRVLQEYSREEVEFVFAGWVYKKSVIYPCLIVSKEKVLDNIDNIYDDDMDYFIIVLNKKRWLFLSNWYSKEVKIRDNLEMHLDIPGKEKMDIFLKLVFKYNMQINLI